MRAAENTLAIQCSATGIPLLDQPGIPEISGDADAI